MQQTILVKVTLDREGRKYNPKQHGRQMHQVESFLATHPTSKMLVVLSTHCIEPGYLVYGGSSKLRNFKACHLGKVSDLQLP